MSINWTTKEKLVLLSDILEYGEQPESWLNISNDLLRTFPNHHQSSQVKLENRYSIKNCKQEYRILVDRYKSEWIEQQSIGSFKYPLPKFISIQLKLIYQNELTIQLNESRRKLTEFCLQLESLIHNKTHRNDSIVFTSSNNEISNQSVLSQPIEQDNFNLNHFDQISQSNENTSEIIVEQAISSSISSDEINQRNLTDNLKEEIDEFPSIVLDRSKLKQQTNIEQIEENSNENSNLTINSLTNEPHLAQIKINETLSLSNKETISSNNSILTSMEIDGISSSSFSSKINSETKSESIRSIGTTSSTGTKYHVYFSPKNSANTSTNNNNNKIKQKKRSNDDTKDEIDNESTSGSDPLIINSTESSKLNLISPSTSQINQNSTTTTNVTAPMTRRSVNTRLVPNNIAEQEEEKTRRFSAMLSENPNSWQSQANSIILYLLSQKQGYLFEFEITDEIAPKYHQFVRKPIALDTIRKNLESNLYLNKNYFKRDIYLMLYNAMKYNPRNHHVHRSAKHLFNQTYPLFQLSAQDIQAQITRRNSISSFSNTTIETPSAKRKRIKVTISLLILDQKILQMSIFSSSSSSSS